jgi:hypothetical protein
MADTKISDLPPASSVDGSEIIPAVKAGSTQRITPAQIKTYLAVSGTNTGDQDLSGLALKSTTVNGQPLSANVTITKSDVGLGNAENTSDANKPISTATALAIAAKQDTLVSTTNIKTINGNSLLGAGDLTITGAGTVTSASVVSANGFAGTVATATTTPAITLTTSVTGLLKGNGTAIAAAVAGTDIKTINSASLIGSGNIAVGTVTTASVATANGFAGTVATASTTPVITLTTSASGLLKGNGTAISAAVSGTDIKTVNGNSLIGSGDISIASSMLYNPIINGGFTVNQRAYVSGAALPSGSYGHDRWKAGAGGGDYSFTQLATSTTITIAANKTLIQVIEDKNVNSTSYVLSWTGTALARYAVNSATPSGAYAASPITITGQNVGSTLSIEFGNGASTGTLSGVQLTPGSSASSYVPRLYGEELLLCQRYFPAWSNGVNGAYCPGLSFSSTQAIMTFGYQVPPRVVPTGIVTSTASGFQCYTAAGSVVNLTALSYDTNTSVTALSLIATVASGLASGDATALKSGAGATFIYATGCEL